jgi:hypothetical protein
MGIDSLPTTREWNYEGEGLIKFLGGGVGCANAVCAARTVCIIKFRFKAN